MGLGRAKAKQRDSICYDTKVRRMKAWHSRLLRLRAQAIAEDPLLEHNHRWKALQPISHYIDLIKSPVGGGSKSPGGKK